MLNRSVLDWRGFRISVAETGEGEPLLLLPGLGGSADLWTPFIEQFPDRRIVIFDAPGTGRSSTPMFPVPVPALAALAAAVLDDRGIESTDVVGFSYGGAVAQQLAYDFPERIEKLVLAATTCGAGAFWGSLEAMGVLATPFRFYSEAYFERTAAAVYGGETGRNIAKRRNQLAARLRNPPSAHGYAMQLAAGIGWSSYAFLADIPHETLVISGDDDPLVPVANSEMLARHIPRARLEIVEGAGHLLLWDEAERVAKRIIGFVA